MYPLPHLAARFRQATVIAVSGVLTLTLVATGTAASAAPSRIELHRSQAQSTSVHALLAADQKTHCAVTFSISGARPSAINLKQDDLYSKLPIPTVKGKVFGGWYTTAAAAKALTSTERINGSKLVACTGGKRTLYGTWVTAKRNKAEKTEVPILMYHKITTKSGGEKDRMRNNYTYSKTFEKQLDYISSTKMYTPTWDELYAFINGQLFLPHRSIIVTEDDVDKTWRAHGQKIVAQKKVLVTQFMITSQKKKVSPNKWLISRSHTHDMHKAGRNGKGLMVNSTTNQVAADLRKSKEYLGVAEVLAYPYGHMNAQAKAGAKKAGFLMARTTKHGRVKIGTDPLAMPTIRINFGISHKQFIKLVD